MKSWGNGSSSRVLVWQAQSSDLKKKSRVLVAHACNPSYSGDRDLENLGWKPASVNSLQDPISKKTITHKKRAGGMV
jgi:hypothetical protein